MMRRLAVLAFAAVAALPFAAGAQSTDPSPGQVVFDGAIASDRRDAYINRQECRDNGDLRVTWEIDLSGSGALPSGTEYEILASNRTGCPDSSVPDQIDTFTIVQLFPAVSAQQTRLIPISDIGTPFGLSPGCDTDKKLYVCVRVSASSGTFKDAVGPLEFQTRAPSPPALRQDQARAADHAIDVDWDAVSGSPAADSYVIIATRVSNPAEVHRQEILFETKGRVGGDLAIAPYYVSVASVSVAGNEGTPWTPTPGNPRIEVTPISVQDFWERYEGRGGVDDGGCATSGGTGLLAALAALLALRAAGRRRA